MASDKSDYKEALEGLSYKGSLSTIINKIRKVQINTEDSTLQKYLGKVLNNLEEALRNEGKVKAKGLNLNSTIFKDVIQHCSQCINSTKPTWQIIAEQHGWSPPDSKA